MNQETNEDIGILLNVAINEIESAFKTGNSILYGELGEKYGFIAHRVYMNIDAPSKSVNTSFFDKQNKSVLLDPWTVTNRMKSLNADGDEITVNIPEFWNHSDMVKTLIDYLLLTKERYNAST